MTTRAGQAVQQEGVRAARTRGAPVWNWRTFPVFVAFAGGLFIASLINSPPQNGVAAAVQLAAIFAVGYALAHLVVVGAILRRRRRSGAADSDGEWVDDVIYPDDESAGRS